LSSTDKDVVERFQEIVGCGTVRIHPAVKSGWKDSWQWHLGAAREILSVLGAFWPYLGERRQEKATEAIERAVKVGEGLSAAPSYKERSA
jgi:hypothetical protein